MFRTSIRSAGALALLASGALLLSGCSSAASSSSAAASPSASASGSADRKQAMAAYTDCLSQHGVTLPSGRPSDRPSGSPGTGGGPGGGGPGGGGFMGGASMDPTRKAAMQACASLRPQGGQGRGGGLNSTAMQAFVGCMKDHGVTVPATGGMRALNTADPATAAAFKICQPLIPARNSADPSGSASPEATASATP